MFRKQIDEEKEVNEEWMRMRENNIVLNVTINDETTKEKKISLDARSKFMIKIYIKLKKKNIMIYTKKERLKNF